MTSLTTLLPVATASLRRRKAAFAGSYVALTLGVTLVATTGSLLNDTAGDDSPLGAPSLHKVLQFTSAMAAFVAVFVVAGTFAFAVAQRRQEIAMLRAVGATPRQIVWLITGEALAVALAAALSGCLLALPGAPALAAWLVARGAAPEGFTARPTAGPMLLAAAVGLLVALLGAVTAALRAGRVRAVEALGDAAVDRKVMTRPRWAFALLGLLALAGTVGYYLAAPTMPAAPGDQPDDPQLASQWVLGADLLTITALALFAPVLVPPLVRLLGAPLARATAAAPLLARQNALTAVRRTVSTATPAFLTIALTGTVVGSTAAFADAMAAQARATAAARYVLSPGATPLPADAAHRLTAATPGLHATATTPTVVTGLGADTAAFADHGEDSPAGVPSAATVVDGDLATAWTLPVVDGDPADLHGATLAASTHQARGHGWKLGDRINLRLADGTVTGLRLALVYRTQLGLDEVLLSGDATTAHLAGARPGAVHLDAEPADRLGGTLADAHHPGPDPGAHYAWIATTTILGPALLYALIAIVNTMVMSAADRRRDFGVLRLAGTLRRQVLQMVALEAALVVTTAAVLALAVTALTQYGTTALLNHRILAGRADIALTLPWLPLATAAALCLLLAVTAGVLPGRLALAGPATTRSVSGSWLLQDFRNR
ncbi:FtsX-like permease family protein [Kitasatospora sp. SUK 42]|uniref:FtsX-like permease family protein n=1 Tax=Kitasatospora sp. SUK 42 TaxID=1588882 RepID=UPI0018CA7FAA|nr:FtsX-like permease family protein [Kitasatospora sp. SUK 42]MBV2153457.1 FtsX-like permease family protein [Kitasatospora sp. SUK 42]